MISFSMALPDDCLFCGEDGGEGRPDDAYQVTRLGDLADLCAPAMPTGRLRGTDRIIVTIGENGSSHWNRQHPQ
jgi:hypothetical protein